MRSPSTVELSHVSRLARRVRVRVCVRVALPEERHLEVLERERRPRRVEVQVDVCAVGGVVEGAQLLGGVVVLVVHRAAAVEERVLMRVLVVAEDPDRVHEGRAAHEARRAVDEDVEGALARRGGAQRRDEE